MIRRTVPALGAPAAFSPPEPTALNPLLEAGQTTFGGANAFRPNSAMDVRYVLYNPPRNPGELTQRVRLVDARGTVMLDGPLALAPPQAVQAAATQGTRLRVPPARGRYSLIFDVQDKRGKVDVERRADFVVA